MAAQTPEIERVAQRAAESVKAMLIDMLAAGELGEVVVIVGFAGLEPEKRVTTKAKTIRYARGQMSAIERVG